MRTFTTLLALILACFAGSAQSRTEKVFTTQSQIPDQIQRFMSACSADSGNKNGLEYRAYDCTEKFASKFEKVFEVEAYRLPKASFPVFLSYGVRSDMGAASEREIREQLTNTGLIKKIVSWFSSAEKSDELVDGSRAEVHGVTAQIDGKDLVVTVAASKIHRFKGVEPAFVQTIRGIDPKSTSDVVFPKNVAVFGVILSKEKSSLLIIQGSDVKLLPGFCKSVCYASEAGVGDLDTPSGRVFKYSGLFN